MFNLKRKNKEWAEGFDEGIKIGTNNLSWYIRKVFEYKEKNNTGAPKLYTFDEIIEVVERWNKY